MITDTSTAVNQEGFTPLLDKGVNKHALPINIPAIDWITLTTFSQKAAANLIFRWLEDLGDYSHNELGLSVMGYRGRNYDGLFYGQKTISHGKHEGRDHFLLRCSGWKAETFARVFRDTVKHPGDYRITRLDIQITVKGNLSQRRGIVDDLRDHWTSTNGRPPKITLIESKTHTIYVGSRSSERMVRIYEKTSETGELFTRYEIEFKGSLARDAWTLLQHGQATLKNLLAGDLDRYPPIIFNRYYPFRRLREALGPDGIKPQYEKLDHDTVRWLKSQVDSAINKLANDQQAMSDLLPLFQSWYSLALAQINRQEEQLSE